MKWPCGSVALVLVSSQDLHFQTVEVLSVLTRTKPLFSFSIRLRRISFQQRQQALKSSVSGARSVCVRALHLPLRRILPAASVQRVCECSRIRSRHLSRATHMPRVDPVAVFLVFLTAWASQGMFGRPRAFFDFLNCLLEAKIASCPVVQPRESLFTNHRLGLRQRPFLFQFMRGLEPQP
jgi:hypothetical protein